MAEDSTTPTSHMARTSPIPPPPKHSNPRTFSTPKTHQVNTARHIPWLKKTKRFPTPDNNRHRYLRVTPRPQTFSTRTIPLASFKTTTYQSCTPQQPLLTTRLTKQICENAIGLPLLIHLAHLHPRLLLKPIPESASEDTTPPLHSDTFHSLLQDTSHCNILIQSSSDYIDAPVKNCIQASPLLPFSTPHILIQSPLMHHPPSTDLPNPLSSYPMIALTRLPVNRKRPRSLPTPPCPSSILPEQLQAPSWHSNC